MAKVTGVSAERVKQLEQAAIVGAGIVGRDLILRSRDGSTSNAGEVVSSKLPLATVPRITVNGHSIALGAGARIAAADQRLGAILGTPPFTEAGATAGYRGIRNFAVGSSVLIMDDQANGVNYGGFARRLNKMISNATGNPPVGTYARYGFEVPDTTIDIPYWGLNDLGVLGNTARVRKCFENAMRAMIAWGRATCIFFDNHSAVVTKNAQNNTVAPAAAAGYNSGTTSTAFTIGSYATLSTPSDYPGGFVTALILGYESLPSGTITAKVDGATVKTVPIDNAVDYPPWDVRVSYGVVPVRIPVPAGAHALRLETSAGCFLDSFVFEAVYPPLTLIPKLNMPSNPAFWAKPITQAGVDAFNGVLASLAAEFGPDVRLVDTQKAFAAPGGGVDAAKFISDGAHPNDYGYACLAAEMHAEYQAWVKDLTPLRRALTF